MKRKRNWRDEALARAAQRYGRPFKCGPVSLPHEVMVKGQIVVREPSNVTELKARSK